VNVTKKFVPLGEYAPDAAVYNNSLSPYASFESPPVINASNILWVDGKYVPALSFASLGQAIAARCQGATTATDTSDAIHIYAGTGAKLYEYLGSSFNDVSVAGGYTAADASYWKFAQFSSSGYGNLLFATDFNDGIQQIAPGAAAFALITSSTGTAPKCSQIANIGQFVVCGNTQEATNGAVPYRVQWCGINNPTYWGYSSLADQQAQGGQQFMNANYGPINHISNGGQYGLIFQERAITRMYYVGGDAIFDFSGIVDLQRGCLFPNSAVQIGANVYFIAHDGFCMTDGQSVQQIGHGKVDTTFLNNVSQQYADRVRGAYDPIQKLIYWAYCSSGNTTGICDSVIAYNYMENRFMPITESISCMFLTKSFGYTMDTLDNVNTNLDLITPSLDSPYWEGGNQQVGTFDANNNYGTLTGAALAASIDTIETDPNPGGISYFDGARPIFTDSVGNGVVTVTPSTRRTENSAYTVGAAASVNTRTGICNFRASGRYMKATIGITGGFDALMGADVYIQPAGEA